MNKIFKDLENLLKNDEILAKDFPDFLSTLRSKEVLNYLESLSEYSKAEQALREVFFSNNSKLSQYLFKKVYPEVSQDQGFIDYLIKSNREEISLEIKPLYKSIYNKDKNKRIFSKIKKIKLDSEAHKEQILKYLQGNREFVVLTNLEEWYFYSKSHSLNSECTYFAKVSLNELLEGFNQVEDFWEYTDQLEDISIKKPLDERFFKSLKFWVSEISKVKFTTDPETKTELIINLINKFVFIQSLDKFWVIEKDFILKEWSRIDQRWSSKEKERILRKFFEDIDEYFYYLYDTELFDSVEKDETILNYIDLSEKNVDSFYSRLKTVLGVEYGVSFRGWTPGITQYNFRRIDEDILGKSYETYLAEIRKEQGIYYTPQYITNFIVEHTVRKQFNQIIIDFTKKIESKDYESCLELIYKFFLIKVLDPSCGSGSFLIKALKEIWNQYLILDEIIASHYAKVSDFKGGLVRPKNIEEEFQKLLEIKTLLGFKQKREVISKIILRHIFGNDLDHKAVEVAKLNIWLEAIKLNPKVFYFKNLPKDTRNILPDLAMNLINGDSLVGLPDDSVKTIISNKFKKEIVRLSEIRNAYLENPTNKDILKELHEIKNHIKINLESNFKEHLKKCNIELDLIEKTIPFFWVIEYWFAFFNDNGELLDFENIGFNAIIGNPPYFSIRGKGTGSLVQTFSYNFLQNDVFWKNYFRSQSDIYYYFIIRSITLLRESSNLGFIVEDYWIENDYADKLKEIILSKTSINILIKFGKIKKIFEDADNDTCIIILEKQDTDNYLKYIYCKNNFPEMTQQTSNQKLLNHIKSKIEKEDYSDEYIDLFFVEQKRMTTKKWVLSRVNTIEIINKIELNKNQLGDLCYIGQGMVPGRKKEFRLVSEESSNDGNGYIKSKGQKFFEVIDKATEKSYNLEVELLKPLITNSGIKKYYVEKSEDYLIYTIPLQDGRLELKNYSGIINYLKNHKESLKGRYDYNGEKYPWYGYQRIQNIDIFENYKEKIICSYRSIENQFGYDNIGYFGTTDMYAIVLKEEINLDMYYLLGILNSKVLTFWYKEAGKSKGLILEFFANPLSRMPIHITDIEIQREISKKVQEIIKCKELYLKLLNIWENVSNKYRSQKIKFNKFLINEKILIQEGKFDKLWISEINLYPDNEDGIIDKEYQKFIIRFEGEKILKVYGILNSIEELILNIKTNKKEFRDIIYLEIMLLLNSKKKVKSLKDIFSKTEISVIKPNIWEKSHNLINFTVEKIKLWLMENTIKFDLVNIIEINQIINNLEDEIDAFILYLYELETQEIDEIFNLLLIPNSTYKNILKKFNELKKINSA